MVEAIKLLEGNMPASCHQIWVTRCDKQKQLERLRVCRGMETTAAINRIKAQSSQEEKVAFADMVIDTTGLMDETKTQFEVAWGRLPDPRITQARPRLDLTVKPYVKPQAKTDTAAEPSPPEPETPAPLEMRDLAPLEVGEAPEGLQVRRARPSDIPSILLLMTQATNGAVKMKRSDILAALSERGYFIGQVGAEISTVVGWKIDSQVGRVEEIYIYPPEMIAVTGTAVVAEIQKSAYNHLCQIIVAFIPNNAPEEMHRLFLTHGYTSMDRGELANNWKAAVDESQPADSSFMIKLLLDTRLQ
jgi:N-acetylglutamate synthase-like GNAT family acetyltransferase